MVTLVVLLDYSAAFDTVDHGVMLDVLKYNYTARLIQLVRIWTNWISLAVAQYLSQWSFIRCRFCW